jgi:hypothetical protein
MEAAGPAVLLEEGAQGGLDIVAGEMTDTS